MAAPAAMAGCVLRSGRGRYSFVSRILVVDDEPDLRFLLRRIFEKAGHEVTDAGHGAEALECVRGSPPELVVTDMMMPVMGGRDLERRASGRRRCAAAQDLRDRPDPGRSEHPAGKARRRNMNRLLTGVPGLDVVLGGGLEPGSGNAR